MNTNVRPKVIGLTRLEIKPKSTALETDALTTQPSELFVGSENLASSHECSACELDFYGQRR